MSTSSEIKLNILEKSRFDEHENWEEQEAVKKTEFHGDAEVVRRANTSNALLRDIQAKQRAKLQEHGVGYSKDPDKRAKFKKD